MESMNKRTSSVKFLTTVPAGSWGLLDADGNLLGVYDGDASRPGGRRRHLGDVAGEQHDPHDRGVRPRSRSPPARSSTPASPPLSTPAWREPEPGHRPHAGSRRRFLPLRARPARRQAVDLVDAAGRERRPGRHRRGQLVSSVYNRTASRWSCGRTTTAPAPASSSIRARSRTSPRRAAPARRASSPCSTARLPATTACTRATPRRASSGCSRTSAATVNLTDPRSRRATPCRRSQNLTSRTLELFKNDNGSGAEPAVLSGPDRRRDDGRPGRPGEVGRGLQRTARRLLLPVRERGQDRQPVGFPRHRGDGAAHQRDHRRGERRLPGGEQHRQDARALQERATAPATASSSTRARPRPSPSPGLDKKAQSATVYNGAPERIITACTAAARCGNGYSGRRPAPTTTWPRAGPPAS